MTKKELATKIANHMKAINNSIDLNRAIERMTKGMKKSELEKALSHYEA